MNGIYSCINLSLVKLSPDQMDKQQVSTGEQQNWLFQERRHGIIVFECCECHEQKFTSIIPLRGGSSLTDINGK